jgi:hypothetical protein
MMVLSLGVAARIVARFGPKRPLVYGLLLFGLGMLLMARALAVLAGVAAVRTSGLLETGVQPQLALNEGYHAAFLVAARLSLLSALISATQLEAPKVPHHEDQLVAATVAE